MRGGLCKPSRRLTTSLWQSRYSLPRALAPISRARCRRYSSTAPNNFNGPVDFEAIKAEMLSRPPQLHSDMMHPTNSYLLTRALSEFLPEACTARQQIPPQDVFQDASHARSEHEHPVLSPGHHLVYFPLDRRGSELCPDGTDPYHSPRDTPFTRRMWAGGSIRGLRGMVLDDRLALCRERIVDVGVRGSAGAEKVFVEVLREYYVPGAPPRARDDPDPADPPSSSSAGTTGRALGEHDLKGTTEHRTLVFMRTLSDQEKEMNLAQDRRIVKPPNEADYSVTLTPTPALLFHYSALTYNAHRIHLDRSYCREVDGHPDLLVHGPLTLTLMLAVLGSRLRGGESEFVDGVDYRHLAPLYVGQPMRVCVARQRQPRKTAAAAERGGGKKLVGDDGDRLGVGVERNKWDVWVENQHGGLCVKGTAETVKRRVPDYS
ncbi:hypothetical protein F5Y14DRAFT_99074 [Nemania sp. NC0429]|nr:hypothetical protein F5Y14DRAFT_99074 [Nemania sp. NC0429]